MSKNVSNESTATDKKSGRSKKTSMEDDDKGQDQLFKTFEEVAHKELLPILKVELSSGLRMVQYYCTMTSGTGEI
ncbi:MAG: hypothetical protein M1597_03565 [Candidatus Thermoplasmatota archaeon]|nr:hypothetical protein [Candidatus Thermoplasmatota archaeon]